MPVRTKKQRKQPLAKRVASILNEEIRPFLAMHGGDVELKSVKNGIVQVQLKGACQGCAMAQVTFRMGVERLLIERFPKEVKGLEYE